jgi:hypothetical protein
LRKQHTKLLLYLLKQALKSISPTKPQQMGDYDPISLTISKADDAANAFSLASKHSKADDAANAFSLASKHSKADDAANAFSLASKLSKSDDTALNTSPIISEDELIASSVVDDDIDFTLIPSKQPPPIAYPFIIENFDPTGTPTSRKWMENTETKHDATLNLCHNEITIIDDCISECKNKLSLYSDNLKLLDALRLTDIREHMLHLSRIENLFHKSFRESDSYYSLAHNELHLLANTYSNTVLQLVSDRLDEQVHHFECCLKRAYDNSLLKLYEEVITLMHAHLKSQKLETRITSDAVKVQMNAIANHLLVRLRMKALGTQKRKIAAENESAAIKRANTTTTQHPYASRLSTPAGTGRLAAALSSSTTQPRSKAASSSSSSYQKNPYRS